MTARGRPSVGRTRRTMPTSANSGSRSWFWPASAWPSAVAEPVRANAVQQPRRPVGAASARHWHRTASSIDSPAPSARPRISSTRSGFNGANRGEKSHGAAAQDRRAIAGQLLDPEQVATDQRRSLGAMAVAELVGAAGHLDQGKCVQCCLREGVNNGLYATDRGQPKPGRGAWQRANRLHAPAPSEANHRGRKNSRVKRPF